MSLTGKILAGVGVFLVAVILIFGGLFVSVNNNCVSQEAGIKAQYEQNKNAYDAYFKTLKEAVQIPSMYVNDMKGLWSGVMSSRYGNNGSKAMWQWIQEHNPQLDASLYKKVQDIVESGRTDFANNQKMLIDKKRLYEDTYLKKFPTNLIASSLGFPKTDLSEMGIILSDETDEAFKSKKTDPIKLGN